VTPTGPTPEPEPAARVEAAPEPPPPEPAGEPLSEAPSPTPAGPPPEPGQPAVEAAGWPEASSPEPPAAPTPAPAAAGPKESPEPPPEAKPNNKRWYVVKVQSGREESIKEAIERRVRKEGLEEFYGQIVIPTEKVTEVKVDKNGKRVTKTRENKLYPGYLMVEVEYNDRILYLFRETSGVGDFVGGTVNRPPTPMSNKEIQRMMGRPAAEAGPAVPTKPRGMEVGERVTVVDGTFKGMEGEVKEILEAVGRVRVELTIFGRPVSVDLEYLQVEPA
jgi:transcriptional antiterminator NusG